MVVLGGGVVSYERGTPVHVGSYVLVDSVDDVDDAPGEGGRLAVLVCDSPKLDALHAHILHLRPSSLLGPVVPSFRALSGRLKFTVCRHMVNKDSLFLRIRTLNRERAVYRGTSLTKKRTPLGPYRRSMPGVLGGS